MEALLSHVVGRLVQHPDRVKISTRARGGRDRDDDRRPNGSAPCFELRVAPEDFPRVVGRQGRTARALRVLLYGSFVAQGGDDYARPALNIVDPEDDGEPV